MTLLRFISSSIRGIIHVGAHEAQEVTEYVSQGITHVIWIEANPAMHSFIRAKIQPWQETMHLGTFAASDKTGGVAYLNLANNQQSSSLLAFGTHSIQHPHITYVGKVEVDLKRIDDWILESKLDSSVYNAANIDVQGYELSVLKGMTSHLAKIVALECEINLDEVYVDCTKLQELDHFLSGYRFRRVYTSLAKGSSYGNALYVQPKLLPLVYKNIILEILLNPRKILNVLARFF
ncbi:FkbM family methyltransferase [Synechococcus elongatus]|uniref:FkbM family methyltransferase n=1 Tax=Synechococcus elongatus PCC 11802 TaxID=2283154 RepID=A0AAT9K4Z4_SYNEL|nr:FkbM family methyltransferase [Synechococcus elongatus]QFZ91307.1 FkbM family methyltransferase [Synechococcus elongatus PCC 11802]